MGNHRQEYRAHRRSDHGRSEGLFPDALSSGKCYFVYCWELGIGGSKKTGRKMVWRHSRQREKSQKLTARTKTKGIQNENDRKRSSFGCLHLRIQNGWKRSRWIL